MMLQGGASYAVLVLDDELERRIAAAARVMRMDSTEFIARSLQRRCAEVLGDIDDASIATNRQAVHGPMTVGRDVVPGPWAIRPTQSRVLRTVAATSRLSVEAIIGPGRGHAAARARAVTAYLLRNDAGLSLEDCARIIHRKRGTVSGLIISVNEVIGASAPRAQLLECARRLLKNGLSGGKQYPPLPLGPAAARLLSGLLACRIAARLTQPALADRARIARETIARLERLHRRARAATVEILAQALGVPEQSLTAATEDLPALLCPTRPSMQSQ